MKHLDLTHLNLEKSEKKKSDGEKDELAFGDVLVPFSLKD